MELPPDLTAELQPLIASWRENRRATLKLAMHLGDWDAVAGWLNANLTYEDMLADMAALGAATSH